MTYNKKHLWLYMYEVWNQIAYSFYQKVMAIGEYYHNSKQNYKDIQMRKPKIYSLGLTDVELKYWNNRFINLIKDDKLHKRSIKLVKGLSRNE